MKTKNKYLSVVVVGRNDNYGGNFTDRFQLCINWLGVNIKKRKLPVEILVVNYNPIKENKDLREIIKWPDEDDYLSINMVEVPVEIHEVFHDKKIRKEVPLYEYIAKNVGIRRAVGEYILVINPDIILHPEFFRFVQKQKLKKTFYYRSDRYDYVQPRENGQIDKEMFNLINKNVFQLTLKHRKYDINGASYLKLITYRLKNKFNIWKENRILQFENIANRHSIPVVYDKISRIFHTNCSGDFMLMHRENWFRLKGTPENTYLALHADSIFIVQAAVSGLKEKVLSWPIYHKKHERRYDAQKDNEFPEYKVMFKKFINDSERMLELKKPIIYNTDDWGCIKYPLKKIRIKN